MSDSHPQPQPQLQLVQGEKPRRPRRPPKDPGECRPGDTGALHARLRDFGFEVPPQLRRPLGQNLGRTQKPPVAGHKKDERVAEPNNQAAAAATGEAVMSNEHVQGQNNVNPQPQAPAAGGGIDFEAIAQKAAVGILGDAAGLVAKAGEAMDAQRKYHEAAMKKIEDDKAVFTWGNVKKVGTVSLIATAIGVGLILLNAKVNAPAAATPVPTP